MLHAYFPLNPWLVRHLVGVRHENVDMIEALAAAGADLDAAYESDATSISYGEIDIVTPHWARYCHAHELLSPVNLTFSPLTTARPS